MKKVAANGKIFAAIFYAFAISASGKIPANGKVDWIKAPLLEGAVSLKADWRIHPA